MRVSDPRFESWCSDPTHIRQYLDLHGIREYPREEGLVWAARRNSEILANYFLSHGATNLDEAASNASIMGNLGMIKFLLKRGANNYLPMLRQATYYGYADIVSFILSLLPRTAFDYDAIMQQAAYNGHIGIVKLMVDLGARDYDKAILHARYHNYPNIVEFLTQVKSKVQN